MTKIVAEALEAYLASQDDVLIDEVDNVRSRSDLSLRGVKKAA